MKGQFILALCLCVTAHTCMAQWDPSILMALKRHQPEKLRIALSHGYQVNTTDENGANLLMWAVFCGDLNTVKYLIQQGARFPEHGAIFYNSRKSYYGSAQSIAVGKGNLPMLRYLDSTLHLPLDEPEYNPNSRKNDGWSPIIWAVSMNKPEIVSYLKSRNVSLDVADRSGTPLLFFAANRDNIKMIRLLLTAGANPNARDSTGRDLLEHLNLENHTQITNLNAYFTAKFYQLYDSLTRQTGYIENKQRHKAFVDRVIATARTEFGPGCRQLLLIADVLYNMENYSTALPIYLAVAQERKAPEDTDVTYANLLNKIGLCLKETDRSNEAVEYYQESAKRMEKLGHEYASSYATVLSNLGLRYAHIGQRSKAIEMLQRSIAARRSAPAASSLDIVNVIFELGDIFQDANDNVRAAVIYQQGIDLLDSSQLYADSSDAMVLNSLAIKLREAGRYSQALATVQKAIEMLASVIGTDNIAYADCLDNAASIYQLMDIYNMQLKFSKAALDIREKWLKSDDDDVITSLNNVGFAYERNRKYTLAIDYYKKAIGLTLAQKDIDSSGYAVLIHNLARCYTAQKNFKKALPLHRKDLLLSKLINGKNSPDYALALNTMGEFYEDMEDYSHALNCYKLDEALERRIHGEYNGLHLDALSSLAEMYLLTHHADSAAILFTRSNRSFQRYLEGTRTFLSDDQKMTLLDENSYRNEYLPSMLYTKQVRRNSGQVAREIYNEQLFLKGMVLQDQKEVLNAVQLSKDSTTRELFQHWKETRSIEGRQMLLAPTKQIINMDSLDDQIRVIEQKLSARSFAFGQGRKVQQIGAGDICKALHEGEAAIEFIKFDLYENRKHDWGDSTIYAALILRHNDSIPEFIPLFEESALYNSLTDDSGVINSALQIGDLYELQDEENRHKPGSLYSLIWKPMESHLRGVHKIYYSPAGLLNLVSFDAIKISPKCYLIDSIEMVRTSSTRSICFNSPAKAPESATLWGNIRYGWDSIVSVAMQSQDSVLHKKGRSRLKRLTRGGEGWIDLPGAYQELDSISSILAKNHVHIEMDSGRNATEEEFKKFDGLSPELIHITTHGFFLGQKKSGKEEDTTAIDLEKLDNPMFRSGLVLAGANNLLKSLDRSKGGDDGILTAYEVANMNLANTRLVVLSACQTGLGEIQGSEGVFGMQRAFKIAGVGQIVATLWSIDDSETVELISLFYNNLYSGMAARDALHAAQREMRKDHPAFIWGAFVLID